MRPVWGRSSSSSPSVVHHAIGQRRHALGGALARADVQQAVLRLDIVDGDGDDLRDGQTACISQRHRGSISEIGRCHQQALDLLFGHRPGQASGYPAHAQPVDHPGLVQRVPVEELERGEADVGGVLRKASIDPSQMPGTNLFRFEPVRRHVEGLRQTLDLTHIAGLRVPGKAGHAHLIDHPLAKPGLLDICIAGHHWSPEDSARPDHPDVDRQGER